MKGGAKGAHLLELVVKLGNLVEHTGETAGLLGVGPSVFLVVGRVLRLGVNPGHDLLEAVVHNDEEGVLLWELLRNVATSHENTLEIHPLPLNSENHFYNLGSQGENLVERIDTLLEGVVVLGGLLGRKLDSIVLKELEQVVG